MIKGIYEPVINLRSHIGISQLNVQRLNLIRMGKNLMNNIQIIKCTNVVK